jgi:hypothetical protein
VPTFKGQHSHPSPNIKGAGVKQRRLPKTARGHVDPSTLDTESLRYLRLRNDTQDLKYKREAMLLAHNRDELVERALVERQLAFLLIGFRKKALLVPNRLKQKFGPEVISTEVHALPLPVDQ